MLEYELNNNLTLKMSNLKDTIVPIKTGEKTIPGIAIVHIEKQRNYMEKSVLTIPKQNHAKAVVFALSPNTILKSNTTNESEGSVKRERRESKRLQNIQNVAKKAKLSVDQKKDSVTSPIVANKAQYIISKTPIIKSPENIDPHLPKALSNLYDLQMPNTNVSNSQMHRPIVKNEIVRAFEIHQSLNAIKAVSLDSRITTPAWNSSSTMPSDRLKELVETMQKEYDAIMNIPETKFTPWEQKLRLLVQYRVKHGNCLVNTTTSELGKWVSRQRKRSKTNYSRPHERYIVAHDVQVLDKLNFVWQALDDFKPWDYYYEQLKEYAKQNNGSTKIPQLYPPNQRLANWVHNQRKHYEHFITGEKSTKGKIHSHQIKLLNEIGFVWKVRFGRPKKSDARYRNKRYHPEKKKDNNEEKTTETPVIVENTLKNDQLNAVPLAVATSRNA